MYPPYLPSRYFPSHTYSDCPFHAVIISSTNSTTSMPLLLPLDLVYHLPRYATCYPGTTTMDSTPHLWCGVWMFISTLTWPSNHLDVPSRIGSTSWTFGQCMLSAPITVRDTLSHPPCYVPCPYFTWATGPSLSSHPTLFPCEDPSPFSTNTHCPLSPLCVWTSPIILNGSKDGAWRKKRESTISVATTICITQMETPTITPSPILRQHGDWRLPKIFFRIFFIHWPSDLKSLHATALSSSISSCGLRHRYTTSARIWTTRRLMALHTVHLINQPLASLFRSTALVLPNDCNMYKSEAIDELCVIWHHSLYHPTPYS